MKSYPLVVCELPEVDGGDNTAYYSKGHHDKQKFVDKVNYEFDPNYELAIDKSTVDPVALEVEHVEHIYMRWGVNGNYECLVCYFDTKPGRGLFPVTFYDLTEHRYRKAKFEFGNAVEALKGE